MCKKISKIVLGVGFLCVGLLCVANGCSNSKEIVMTRQQYPNIIDISCTPDHETKCRGLFTDNGSWMGFTLPDLENPVNGFCGPFSIDNRYWFAKSAVTAQYVEKPVVVDSINYYPGEIFLYGSSENKPLNQELVFADYTTALLKITAQKGEKIVLSGLDWNENVILTKQQHSVIATHDTGEILIITLPANATTKVDGKNYTTNFVSNGVDYVAISFVYNPQNLYSTVESATKALLNPEEVLSSNNERWSDYLNSVLRDEMPHKYNRIAVKSIVTLISNWRTAREGLLHDGLIPSHAVDYFIGYWAWDSWRFSVALSRFEPELAKNQIRAMFDHKLPDGMVIDCMYTNPDENNSRNSKPPLASWAVDQIYEETKDTIFVKEMYPELLTYHRWWYEKRDHDGNGICEYGSTDGTAIAAAWESGMDNAIRFDDAKTVKNCDDAWSFDQESVDLNAFLAMEYKLLKKFAAIIDVEFNEKDYTAGVADYFFDSEAGFFYDKRIDDKSFVREQGSEAYIPFWTGIASQEQMDQAIKILTDTSKFSTYIPFPTAAADNAKFMPKGYWRGPIWLDQTNFAIQGLRNYGYQTLADSYTVQVFDRLHGLTDQSPIHENYGTHTGELLKAPHFSWSAVHLILLYEEYGN